MWTELKADSLNKILKSSVKNIFFMKVLREKKIIFLKKELIMTKLPYMFCDYNKTIALSVTSFEAYC